MVVSNVECMYKQKTSTPPARSQGLYPLVQRLRYHLPALSLPQARGLALWSTGIRLGQTCSLSFVALFWAAQGHGHANALRKRLGEFYLEGKAKSGQKRRSLEVQTCFAGLLHWGLSLKSEPEVFLVMDATHLKQRFIVLSLSLVTHAGAIPVAWKIMRADHKGSWNPQWKRLLRQVRGVVPDTQRVWVLTDRGLYSPVLFRAICRNGWHPLMRVNQAGSFRPLRQPRFIPFRTLVAAEGVETQVEGRAFKTHPLRATLLTLKKAGYAEPWILLTDATPGEAEAVFYRQRSWIEGGFKHLKSGGWQWQKTHMHCPERAERMWLALAVAMLLTFEEALQEKAGQGSFGQLWDQQARCASIFRLGSILSLVSLSFGMGPPGCLSKTIREGSGRKEILLGELHK